MYTEEVEIVEIENDKQVCSPYRGDAMPTLSGESQMRANWSLLAEMAVTQSRESNRAESQPLSLLLRLISSVLWVNACEEGRTNWQYDLLLRTILRVTQF